jgi:hypothetical protein
MAAPPKLLNKKHAAAGLPEELAHAAGVNKEQTVISSDTI